MEPSTSKKRALIHDTEDDSDHMSQGLETDAQQKRKKSLDDVHDIILIPKHEAWFFDTQQLSKSSPLGTMSPATSMGIFEGDDQHRAKRLLLLCVIGEMTLHYSLVA